WHGVKLYQPDWSPWSHSVAFSTELGQAGLEVYFIFNAYREALDFELPPAGGDNPLPWRRWIDTALDSPNDILPWEPTSAVPGSTYHAGAQSVVLLARRLG